jgi:hypothetical protein
MKIAHINKVTMRSQGNSPTGPFIYFHSIKKIDYSLKLYPDYNFKNVVCTQFKILKYYIKRIFSISNISARAKNSERQCKSYNEVDEL